jgi:hypothetical protein
MSRKEKSAVFLQDGCLSAGKWQAWACLTTTIARKFGYFVRIWLQSHFDSITIGLQLLKID